MRVDFSIPVEFEEVPLGMDFGAALHEVCARGAHESQMSETREKSLSEMARTLEAISRSLSASGVLYAGNCLHSFEGEVSLGSLAVAVVDYDFGDDPATAARGTLRGILNSRGENWTGSVIDAPCGQAAIFTGGQRCVLPSALSPSGEIVEVLTAQFHAMIPVPAGSDEPRRMCLVAFSTPQVTHWEKCYAPLVVRILRSLRFIPDEEHAVVDKIASTNIEGG
ncbi:hypothetical protein [Streptomyces tendae]|uniref:hypothetical protein n=1 Tax=Streptomyces tendae TaxID=1932 RepID=UPI0036699636